METLPRAGVSRADMMKRVARFSELKGSDGGLPDSRMKGCIRTLYNVIGFQPPKEAGGAVTSPVGDATGASCMGNPSGRARGKLVQRIGGRQPDRSLVELR